MFKVNDLIFSRNGRSFTYDFTMQSNEWLSIVGPSGSGKSTLLELIAGFLQPNGGGIYLNEKSILLNSPGKRNLSYIFQSQGVFEHLSVLKNLQLCMHDNKSSKAEKSLEILKMLELVKLDSKYLLRFPSELSVGEKSRLQIARAMLRPFQLLLMDEPFSALETNLRETLLKIIHALQKEHGFMVIFVTHQLEDAAFNNSRILTISDGHIS